jgi:hypothetical protein
MFRLEFPDNATTAGSSWFVTTRGFVADPGEGDGPRRFRPGVALRLYKKSTVQLVDYGFMTAVPPTHPLVQAAVCGLRPAPRS